MSHVFHTAPQEMELGYFNDLGNVYFRNGELTFERVAEAQRKFEQRCLYVTAQGEDGYVYESEDGGATWEQRPYEQWEYEEFRNLDS